MFSLLLSADFAVSAVAANDDDDDDADDNNGSKSDDSSSIPCSFLMVSQAKDPGCGFCDDCLSFENGIIFPLKPLLPFLKAPPCLFDFLYLFSFLLNFLYLLSFLWKEHGDGEGALFLFSTFSALLFWLSLVPLTMAAAAFLFLVASAAVWQSSPVVVACPFMIVRFNLNSRKECTQERAVLVGKDIFR